MKTIDTLAPLIAGHARVLFGREVGPSDLRVAPVARKTRSIFRIEAAGHDTAVIAKLRPSNADEDRRIAALETSHEFARLRAVWDGLERLGTSTHRVPRPLLVLPDAGVLFMEQCSGSPVAGDLRWWIFGLRGAADVARRMSQCGEWLHRYSSLAQSIAWPVVTPEDAAILNHRRARHHVYRLIGRSGEDLAQAMTEGSSRRLAAYKVDAALERRIEGAFRKQFKDFGGGRDLQGPVHGKYSPADVLTVRDQVSAVDLEQAGIGSLYLDVAYFLYQVFMVTRWRPFGLHRGPAADFRRSFLTARFGNDRFDDGDLNAFVAYYLVNSLRPGGGAAGWQARSYASRWLEEWVVTVERGVSS